MRAPYALAITVGSPPSRTDTQLLVVPRSIPTALAIVCAPFVPLEPDLGSRPAEPESILPKRLSRRDSGFIQENHEVKELIPEVVFLAWNLGPRFGIGRLGHSLAL